MNEDNSGGSPGGIDLNMDLLSSPCPPMLKAAGRNDCNDNGGSAENNRASSADRGEDTTNDRNDMNDESHGFPGASSGLKKLKASEASKRTSEVEQHSLLDGTTVQTIESWTRELDILSIKNACILDDLVKLGADV
mmetsp:Transcript_34721/g.77923  ORF Transcript_34721/g.77923 Transcript_34721/m.77923 type:complete len:136 (-) Transcript_34721:98-505(-)